MNTKTRYTLVSTMLWVAVIVILSLSPALSVHTSQAQGPEGTRHIGDTTDAPPTKPAPVSMSVNSATDELRAVADPATRHGRANIIIELTEPTAFDVLSAQSGDLTEQEQAAILRGQIAQVENAQNQVLSGLSAKGIDYTVVGTTERVLSSVMVNADVSNLEVIQQLPGVKDAYEEQIVQLDNASSVPFIGAPQLWNSGKTGQGIKVGLIDSGIDYSHANFGGDGVAHATGVCNPADFPSAKVAGGYDFVGDTWTSGGALVPDSDPCDQNGHGSHVGGTIAGYGVTGAGATYTGPWDSSIPFGSMTIGPGVAPQATLYALKVGSSSNSVSSAAAIQALEWATDPDGNGDPADHLDVINMSIGGDFGNPNTGWSVAVDNAAKAGIVVVSSAGNAGDTYFIQGAPSTADWAISVAASVDGSLGFEVLWSAGTQTYEAAAASFGPSIYDVTAQVELVNDGTGAVTDGCQALTGFTAGHIALIDRGTCAFTQKVLNAQTAGAAGVLIANTSSGSFGGLGGTEPAVTIPSVMIQYADGQTLRAGLPVQAHMSAGIVFGATADTLASFSSRGPQRETVAVDVALKPDIAAPGSGIISTGMGTGTGSANYSGTSMASPHVAGAVALTLQARLDWSVDEIKAVMMNTATHPLYSQANQTGPIYSPQRVGTGRVDVVKSAFSPVIAYNSAQPELVSVSFGLLNVTAATTLTRTITVENKGPDLINFNTEFWKTSDVPGPEFSISPSQITVGPYGKATLTVTLNIPDPNTWTNPHSHDVTVSETQGGYDRFWLSEESGLIRLRAKNVEAVDLWVPVYAAPRPASTLSSALDTVPAPGTSGLIALEMTGNGIDTPGSYPYKETSLVSAFELAYEDADDSYSTGARDAGDIQYIGITTDAKAITDAGYSFYNYGRVYFALSAYGDWASLSEEAWVTIYIDADQNGSDDYSIGLWNWGAAIGGDSSDVWIPLVTNLSTNSTSWYGDYVNDFSPADIDTAPFESNVIFFGVWASEIGLTDTDGAFDYQVYTYGDFQLTDLTPWLTYDALAQSFDFNHSTSGPFFGAPTFVDQAGPSVPVNYDWSTYSGPLPPCVLLLHHHNADGERSDVVCLANTDPVDVGVTDTVDKPNAGRDEVVTFTITASNLDTVNPIGAVVTEVLSNGLIYQSGTPSQGTFDSGTGEWAVGALPASGSATLEITAQVSANDGEVVSNTAHIDPASGIDTNPGNNDATASIDVGGVGTGGGSPSLSVFDPAISKVGTLEAGGIGLPGENLTWTITVTNNGSGTATNVIVTDTVRSELRIDSADIDSGAVSINGQTVTFTIPSLGPGASTQMHIYTTVLSSPLDGLFTNSASVSDGTVSQTTSASVASVSSLPSTGYPPETSQSGLNLTWLLAVGAAVLALAATIGGVALRRRTQI